MGPLNFRSRLDEEARYGTDRINRQNMLANSFNVFKSLVGPEICDSWLPGSGAFIFVGSKEKSLKN